MKNSDALVVLEEVATSLREAAESAEVVSAFDEGRMVGYYEALSAIIAQCKAFDIGLDQVGLDGFDAESLVGKFKKAA